MSTKSTFSRKSRLSFRLFTRFSLRGFIIFVFIFGTALGLYAERARRQMRVCEQLTSSSISWGFANPPYICRFWPDAWGNVSNNHWCCSIKWVSYEERSPIPEGSLRPRQAFELIATLPSVQWLYLSFFTSGIGQSKLSDSLAPIANVSGLQTLSVDTENNDLFMSACKPMSGLRDLRLNKTLSSEGLKHLSKFPNLREFSSDSRTLTGSGFGDIANMPHLENVELDCLECELSELQPFQGHQTLQSFASATAYTDQMLELFSTCPQFRTINASGSMITDDGMVFVSKMKMLEQISFANVSVSDVGFARLVNCSRLQSIDASGCKLTNAVADTLVRLSELKSLNLANTLTTSAILPELQRCKQLSQLTLGSTQADVDEVLDFAMKRLPLLNVDDWGPSSWRNALSCFGLKQLPTPGTPISNFDFSNLHGIHGRFQLVSPKVFIQGANFSNTDLDDSDLAILAQSYDFFDLDISHTKVTAQGLAVLNNQSYLGQLTFRPFDDVAQTFSALSNLTRLRALTIVDSQKLTDDAFRSLATMVGLNSLNLDSEIDEKSLEILSQSTSLQFIQSDGKSIGPAALTICQLGGFNPFLNTSRVVNPVAISYSSWGKQEVANEKELALLANSQVAFLSVRFSGLSSKAIESINNLELSWLDLSNTGIDDEQLKLLKGPNLRGLILSDNPITDESIEQILKFESLNNLEIASTQITNNGLSRLLGVLPLRHLDISGTQIDAEAWLNAAGPDKSRIETLVIKDIASAISVLTKLPIDRIPAAILTESDTAISSNMIRVLRGEPIDGDVISRSDMPLIPAIPDVWSLNETAMPLLPATLDAWSLDTILKANSQGPFLKIAKTGRLTEILERLTQFPEFTQIRIVNDALERPLRDVPQQVRGLTLESCELDTQTLESIAQFRWLRSLTLVDCNFEGCSFEPLTHMALLSRLSISRSNLSSDQIQVLNRLRPTLIESRGW